MSDNDQQQMFPTFTIVSNDFDKDLAIVKRIFSGLQEMTHTENGFKLSDRAEMAAGWWFYDVFFTQEFAKKMFETVLPPETRNMKGAKIRIIDALQGQLKKYGSEAKIKMHGDIPFAAPWWAWLMK
ncbi:MAG TPA: hypothetical protein VFS46_02195 [Nitrososphaera sp.]|nr:hypothetical protein [Nitrososphaera sp.]